MFQAFFIFMTRQHARPYPSKRHGADSSLINLFNKKAGTRAMRTPAFNRDGMLSLSYT